MKAIHLEAFVESHTSPALAPRTIPDPTLDAAADHLIRVEHAGINYVDLLYIQGKHQNNRALIRPPFTPGLEFSGTVLRAPPSSPLTPGTRVFGATSSGAFAELLAAPGASLRRVPTAWTLRGAAGVAATAPVAYGALAHVARVAPGEWVLVHAAAGGLGAAAVQVARARGARVVGTVGAARKAQVARALGAEHVVLYGEEGWEARVRELTGGGVHVTFDTVGLVEASIRCSRYAGRVVVVGFAGREGRLESVRANRVLLKSIQLLGYRYGEHGRQIPGEMARVWAGVEDLIERGLLRPVVYDDEVFNGLEAVPRALRALADRRVWGKAIVNIEHDTDKANL